MHDGPQGREEKEIKHSLSIMRIHALLAYFSSQLAVEHGSVGGLVAPCHPRLGIATESKEKLVLFDVTEGLSQWTPFRLGRSKSRLKADAMRYATLRFGACSADGLYMLELMVCKSLLVTIHTPSPLIFFQIDPAPRFPLAGLYVCTGVTADTIIQQQRHFS